MRIEVRDIRGSSTTCTTPMAAVCTAISAGSLLDCVYFSFTTYTTPHISEPGDLRYLTGRTLTGLITGPPSFLLK